MNKTPNNVAPEQMSIEDVLRIPTMRKLWYAALLSTFGDFLALFAVISVFTFQIHATSQQVTGVQISYMLPIAILGVLAGVFVDRWSVKFMLVTSDFVRAALCLLLVGAHEAIMFYFTLGAISVVSSFFGPAQGIALRTAVPLHGLRSANALMQQVMFGMRIVGPAVAALMIAQLGARSCYLVDSVSFVCSGCLLASLTLSHTSAATPIAPVRGDDSTPASPTRVRILADMRVGVAFIVQHPGVLFVMLALSSGLFVLGCLGPLIAIYIRDFVHGSTQTFGIASAMIGIGMFVGINVLSTLVKNVINETLVYCGLGGIAIGLCVLTVLTHFWTTVLANFVIGSSVAAIILPATTIMQQETPPALMGRVGSTFMSFIFTAQICGLILSSVLTDRIGAKHVFALCAALLGILILAGCILSSSTQEASIPDA
jgi:DHA3 family macrolide efflux protein-like MFS transporter